MTSVQDKINHLLSKGITRSELQNIAKRVYMDRLMYSIRKPGNGTTSRAVIALNLIYYNQWILGPYLRELRQKQLPWYKRLFGGKDNDIKPIGKDTTTRTVETKGIQSRIVKDRTEIGKDIDQQPQGRTWDRT